MTLTHESLLSFSGLIASGLMSSISAYALGEVEVPPRDQHQTRFLTTGHLDLAMFLAALE